MAFAVLSFSQLVHTLNMRSKESIFRVGIASNRKLLLAIVLCAALQAAVILIEPVSRMFKTQMLSPLQWAIVLGLAFVPLFVVELEKRVFKKRKK